MKGDRSTDHDCPTCYAKKSEQCSLMPVDEGSLMGPHMARLKLAFEVIDRATRRGRYAL